MNREHLAYHGYRAVRWLAQALPEKIGHDVFEGFAWLGWKTLPRMRATVAANQARVLGLPEDDPRVRASTREAFRLYARYWHEGFLGGRWSDEEVLARFECDGFEHLEAAVAEGHGAITALPHMGNWDLAGRWMAAKGYPVVSVAEELKPKELFDMWVRHRTDLKIDVLGLSSNGQVGRQLALALERNRVVALVADRDLGGRGVLVEMFGAMRKIPAGPALLSITTGAPLIPSPVYATPHGWKVVMYEPLLSEPSGDRKKDIATLTRKLAAAFERAIAAAPADWHAFLPAWDEPAP